MATLDDADERSPTITDSLPFIVSLDNGKVNESSRKFIRSHAMRGRKQTRTFPRKNVLVHGCDMVPGRVQTPLVKFEDIMRMCSPPARRIGTDFSFLASPANLEPVMLSNVIQVSPIAQKIVYPLITAVGNQVDNRGWIQLCMTDAAALNVTAFSIEAFVDLFLQGRREINPAAMLHFRKGLTLFSERLAGSDEELKISDANVGVVLKLAAFCALCRRP